MEKKSEGVEPDQRRNHEGYQHDRFPANADAVAASGREFSWGIPPAEACLSGQLYRAGRSGQADFVGIVTRAQGAAAMVAARAWAATAANDRPTATRNAWPTCARENRPATP